MRPPARLVLALPVLVLTAACATGPAAVHRRPLEPPERHVLPNGVRVLVAEQRAGDVAAVQLWVRAGARDETAGEVGLAHHLERLLFTGTPARPAGAIEREIQRLGGRMGAYAAHDYTYHEVVLPARHVATAIDVLADVAVNAALDQADLARETSATVEAAGRADDAPEHLLAQRVRAALYDGHPYGRPVSAATRSSGETAREALVRFYRRHYVPEAFTLVVVGPVRPRDVFDAAARAFGKIPWTGASRLPPPPPPAPARRSIAIARPGEAAHLALGWLAPRLDHADTPAVDLLAIVLGQGPESRLARALRERGGTASASYTALEGGGFLVLSARVAPADLEWAEAAIAAEIRRLAESGVSDGERARAVAAAEERRAARLATVEGRAFLLGRAETLWRLEEELAYPDRLRAVTGAQMLSAARRYLDLDRCVRVTVAP